MSADILKQVGELYVSYDGSIPWIEFMGNYRKSSKFERDTWLIATGMHHPKDSFDTWAFVTIWAPFMEKIPLVDEIWQFWRAQSDAEDRRQLDAGEWTITQIDQRRGPGEYWLVETRYKDQKTTGTTPLKRVNGEIMVWESEL